MLGALAGCKCTTHKALPGLCRELVATGRAEKLKGFEIIKNIHLDTENAIWQACLHLQQPDEGRGCAISSLRPFSIEDDTLTPTFKLKRPQLLKKYKQQVRGACMLLSRACHAFMEYEEV
eukprot:1156147-Pelagomonas_calceolata.AAC.3